MAYAPARELEQGSAFGDVEDIRSHVELKPLSKLEALFRARLAMERIGWVDCKRCGQAQLVSQNRTNVGSGATGEPCSLTRAVEVCARCVRRGEYNNAYCATNQMKLNALPRSYTIEQKDINRLPGLKLNVGQTYHVHQIGDMIDRYDEQLLGLSECIMSVVRLNETEPKNKKKKQRYTGPRYKGRTMHIVQQVVEWAQCKLPRWPSDIKVTGCTGLHSPGSSVTDPLVRRRRKR